MKKMKPILQTLFLVLFFSHIPEAFQEQVKAKPEGAPAVELPESKEKSVGFKKPVSVKSTSEDKTKFISDGRVLDREVTIDKSYSNAETSESSAVDDTVKPALEEPTRTFDDAKSLLDARQMSWPEASGMRSTSERPVDNLRARGSYSSGGSPDDDDDDDGEDDEASGVSVIVVIVGVGAVVLLAAIVLAILWCRKRQIAKSSGKVRNREVSSGAPVGDANEEALLDDAT